MLIELKVPEVGESITEGYLSRWLVPEGSYVQPETELYELETDKVTMPVPAGYAGLLHILVQADQDVLVGQVVGSIDSAAQAGDAPTVEASQARAAREAAAEDPTPFRAPPISAPPTVPAPAAMTSPSPTPAPTPSPTAAPASPIPPPVEPPADMDRARESLGRDAIISPAVQRMLEDLRVDPASVRPTGPRGRMTKEDVLRERTAPPAEPSPAPAPAASAPRPLPVTPPAAEPPPSVDERPRQTRSKVPRMRARIAERLLQAQANAAILTTFNEVDMGELMALRKRHKQAFADAHGVNLGFMSFFVKAVVGALKAVPAVNGWIEGDELVTNHYYDIGVAVSTDRGLMVPVVRDADKKSLAQVEADISLLAEKGRDGRLSIADLQGGVFTISNGGVFGSLLSTPILNPPQSGILGMHGIKKRPVVRTDADGNDSIVIRPMMYLALSYDHRLVDGKQAVTFLKHIVECVEDPERILLGTCAGD
jgi:2-oxoglutarate dehydrogenase E2 component (dihydrolipoamide succinyltransferase)